MSSDVSSQASLAPLPNALPANGAGRGSRKCNSPASPYNPRRVFDLIQVLYWLALSSWFGGVLFIAIAAPIIMRAMREEKPVLPILRAAAYFGAVALFIYHWRVLWPRMWKVRQEYIDNADNPDVANPALEQLDRLQAESASVLFFLVTLLLGLIVFSANIRPA